MAAPVEDFEAVHSESEEETKIAPPSSRGWIKIAAVALGLGLVGLLGLAGTQSFGVFPGKSSPSLDTMSKMMIYKDVVSGDEMTSDSFKSSVEFDGAALKVQMVNRRGGH